MKRRTQAESNPYPHSDSNKRYQTFDYYMKRRFGKKCVKIPLDAGFTCPNIDGSKGRGGCVYCLGGSSAAAVGTLEEQYDAGTAALSGKWSDFAGIPYLQAHTNTYAPPDELRRVYRRCVALPGAVMLAVATRADCLSKETVAVLREISEEIPMLVELGLQTSSDETAKRINRGHSSAEFLEGYRRLREAGGDIAVCIHIINGLPGEDHDIMLETARFTAALTPDMVKIHLLHVLRGTSLYKMYINGEYTPMERDDYVRTAADQIELMPPDTVIARLTGDGVAARLAAPEWSRKKVAVINDIDKELYRRGSCQGIKFELSQG